MNEWSAAAGTSSGAAGDSTDQVSYLQRLLDEAHAELTQYRRGLVEEIRQPLLMELIGLALAIEDRLNTFDAQTPATDLLDFIEHGILVEIRQALSRYNVEPFICSTRSINRRLQKVQRVEETREGSLDGQVRPVTRGYAQGDKVLQKEQVILFKAVGQQS